MSTKTLTLIGLTRKSKGEDDSTHKDQSGIINARAEREGFTVLRIDSEKGISGTKAWRDREVGRALADCIEGRADGIIVAFEDRISRESMAETAAMWDAFREAGIVFIACDGVDSRQEGANLTFAIKAAIARDKIEVTARRSDLGRARAVIELGVHSGSGRNPGYVWTERADGSKNVQGDAKHGPLAEGADFDLVRETLEAFASYEITGTEAAQRIGVSRNIFQRMVTDSLPVYEGVAFSGGFKNDGSTVGQPVTVAGVKMTYGAAHPRMISTETADAIRTRMSAQAAEFEGRTERVKREPVTTRALTKVVRCSVSGRAMSYEAPRKAGGDSYWKCKAGTRGDCACGGQSIPNSTLLPFALDRAVREHAFHAPLWAMGRAVDNVYRPALEQRLARAEEAYAVAVDMLGVETLPSDSKQARERIEAVEALREHSQAQGWIAQPPEAVQDLLKIGDEAEINRFLRQTITLSVATCGRNALRTARAVENRVSVAVLLAGAPAVDETAGALAGAVESSASAPVVSGVEAQAVAQAVTRVQA